MALKVTERSVVGQDVESIVDSLERTSGRWRRFSRAPTYARISATLRRCRTADPLDQRRLGQVRPAVADRSEQFVLSIGIEVDEFDLRGRFDRDTAEQLVDELRGVGPGRREVVDPATTPVGQIDAREESSGSPCGARAASTTSSAAPRAADGRACGAAMPRRPVRSRRCRDSTTTPPEHAPRRIECLRRSPGDR